jgi:hypothetical protein
MKNVSMNLRRSILPFLVATTWANAGYTEVIDIEWKPSGAREVFSHEGTIAEKKIGEVCGKLKKGETVTWRYVASAPLDFNIHFHEGKKVEYLTQTKGAISGENKFVAPADQDYCWMWTNRAKQTATYSIELAR